MKKQLKTICALVIVTACASSCFGFGNLNTSVEIGKTATIKAGSELIAESEFESVYADPNGNLSLVIEGKGITPKCEAPGDYKNISINEEITMNPKSGFYPKDMTNAKLIINVDNPSPIGIILMEKAVADGEEITLDDTVADAGGSGARGTFPLSPGGAGG